MIRIRRHRPPPSPEIGDAPIRDAPVPLTCATDRRTHLVAIADLERAIAERSGHYRTLCGRAVLAAALAAPPGPRCAACYAPKGAPATARHDDGGLNAVRGNQAALALRHARRH